MRSPTHNSTSSSLPANFFHCLIHQSCPPSSNSWAGLQNCTLALKFRSSGEIQIYLVFTLLVSLLSIQRLKRASELIESISLLSAANVCFTSECQVCKLWIEKSSSNGCDSSLGTQAIMRGECWVPSEIQIQIQIHKHTGRELISCQESFEWGMNGGKRNGEKRYPEKLSRTMKNSNH